MKNSAPWLLLEAKWSDGPIESHHRKIQEALGHIPFVQVCRQEHVALMEGKNRFRISASRLLG